MTTNYPAKQIEDLVRQHGEGLRATAAVAREIATVAAARVGALPPTITRQPRAADTAASTQYPC
jgi:hypothetical protein